ncbi:LWR-salt protein [Natronocalculus amylovorans]|uniref:LWR-salt protein n=1 Tax=Natronocalculus amylovorans TaxID=2917812 RepID=A0AAE3FW17_9EURY|nr:LWR-salt protein [Natronocalculus amylovorans]MCL9816637.1 LWR-salt protein [Natronocalculus amylovorans]
MDSGYIFRVEFRLSPAIGSVEPHRFKTVYRHPLVAPPKDGWLFFRDWLWHGELTDRAQFRPIVSDALGVTVTNVQFSEVVISQPELECLDVAIENNLNKFGPDTSTAVRHAHLGSSIRVVDKA